MSWKGIISQRILKSITSVWILVGIWWSAMGITAVIHKGRVARILLGVIGRSGTLTFQFYFSSSLSRISPNTYSKAYGPVIKHTNKYTITLSIVWRQIIPCHTSSTIPSMNANAPHIKQSIITNATYSITLPFKVCASMLCVTVS